MRLFSKCETCKNRKFIIRKRKIVMPTGDVALSQKLMCRHCKKVVQEAVNFNKNGK